MFSAKSTWAKAHIKVYLEKCLENTNSVKKVVLKGLRVLFPVVQMDLHRHYGPCF